MNTAKVSVCPRGAGRELKGHALIECARVESVALIGRDGMLNVVAVGERDSRAGRNAEVWGDECEVGDIDGSSRHRHIRFSCRAIAEAAQESCRTGSPEYPEQDIP